MRKPLFWALLPLLLGGCATGGHPTLEQIDQPGTSLLFGYMDMTEAPSSMSDFDMKTLPAYDQTCDFEVDHGLFYDEAVATGSYQLDEFGGTSSFLIFFNQTYHRYSFLNPDAQFRIATPSIYYLGSFKYVPDKDAFDIARIKTPTESELLQRLLPKVAGTKWEPLVEQRLKALGLAPVP